MKNTLPTGLVLSGGGARAGYQVGVLKAIAQIRRESFGAMGELRRRREARDNPFKIIAGTSAGAVNGVALACGSFPTEPPFYSWVRGLLWSTKCFHSRLKAIMGQFMLFLGADFIRNPTSRAQHIHGLRTTPASLLIP